MDLGDLVRASKATNWPVVLHDLNGQPVYSLVKPCGSVATRGEIEAVLLTLEEVPDGRTS